MSKTCLAIVCPGTVHMECAESIMAVITTKAALWAFFHKSGPYMDMARNELVEKFYQKQFMECDKLLMVDSDIEFTPEDVMALEAQDLPIVSGVYHNFFDGRLFPIAYNWGSEEKGMQLITDWTDEDTSLTTVDGVGAGFLMIDRKVFDAFKEAYSKPRIWFTEETIGSLHYGEDFSFCMRAKSLGFDIHVDRKVQVVHHKGVRLGGPQPRR